MEAKWYGEDGTKRAPPRPASSAAAAHLLDDGLEPRHGDDGDPHRHERAEEVAELQDVVLHDAEDHDARLVAGVVELSEQRR